MAGTDPEGNEPTGGQLRQKLEEALAQNATLVDEVRQGRAEKLIGAKGYTYVTPEDLKGVGLDELEAKAEEVEGTKRTTAEAALRSAFGAKGLTGEELDAAVAAVVGKDDGQDTTAALDRFRGASKVTGTAPGKIDEQQLFGKSRIAAAYANKK